MAYKFTDDTPLGVSPESCCREIVGAFTVFLQENSGPDNAGKGKTDECQEAMETMENERYDERNGCGIDMHRSPVHFCICRGRVWSHIQCMAGCHTGADSGADFGNGTFELWIYGDRKCRRERRDSGFNNKWKYTAAQDGFSVVYPDPQLFHGCSGGVCRGSVFAPGGSAGRGKTLYDMG